MGGGQNHRAGHEQQHLVDVDQHARKSGWRHRSPPSSLISTNQHIGPTAPPPGGIPRTFDVHASDAEHTNTAPEYPGAGQTAEPVRTASRRCTWTRQSGRSSSATSTAAPPRPLVLVGRPVQPSVVPGTVRVERNALRNGARTVRNASVNPRSAKRSCAARRRSGSGARGVWGRDARSKGVMERALAGWAALGGGWVRRTRALEREGDAPAAGPGLILVDGSQRAAGAALRGHRAGARGCGVRRRAPTNPSRPAAPLHASCRGRPHAIRAGRPRAEKKPTVKLSLFLDPDPSFDL